jgi:hypothetical protein
MEIPLLLMLEDDQDRIARFTRVVEAFAPPVRLLVWRSARVMVREVEPHLASALLISLDHDLEPSPDDPEDPGDGIEVARFLGGRKPLCPVIVHSSNGTRSDWMVGELDLGGWRYKRVAPLGEDWIEAYWAVVARGLIGR